MISDISMPSTLDGEGWSAPREGLLALFQGLDTPFFVYDMPAIERRIAGVRQALGPDLKLYYAVKANPNPELLHRLSGLVDGLDISSGGELRAAMDRGWNPGTLSFAGPGKSMAELTAAVASGLGSISVESPTELGRIQQLAAQLGAPANVTLRINPSRLTREFAVKMGGRPAPFGIDEEEITGILDRLDDMPDCRMTGLHIYAGTQCLVADALVDNFRHSLDIARRVMSHRHGGIGRINFGGGFGIPYHAGQQPLDVREAGGRFRELFAEFRRGTGRSRLMGIVELGRFLVAQAGLYVARVVDVKRSRGRTYCVVDGGMHHHLSASGNFGQVIRKNFRLVNLSAAPDAPVETVTVVGPLCTSLDVLGDQVTLGAPRLDDCIAVFDSGAYAYSASPLLFLSHPTPAEYLLEAGERLTLIRPSLAVSDLFRTGGPPDAGGGECNDRLVTVLEDERRR
ncbi:MAG: type III PLP-dependent enzyme [Magnetococcales bacterium]|nr:type III PLP-dependent enzyme [Magnetococcales bacterium]